MAPAASAAAKSIAYSFDAKAYGKAVMHCCKHSSEACFGVFLGRSNGKVLQITDAMPLFHTHSLGPMLKAAFMMIEQHCRNVGGGLEIVGIYHATSSGNTDITPVKAIADKVASTFSGASVWAFDSNRLAGGKEGAPGSQFCLTGLYHSKDEWKGVGAEAACLSDDAALKQTATLLSEMKYLDIVDFDDHLASPTMNWLNPTLFQGDAIMERSSD